MIEFGQYEPDDTWHRRSGFRFECYHNNFVPSAYPEQICGNGTKDEVALFKKQNNWTDSRQATIFYNVFTNDGIVQTDSDCASTARAMTNRCKNATQQYEAARLCWPLVAKPRFNMCILRNLERSESAMRHCVEYVCSGFTDPNACDALSEEIDRCQELVGVSYRVRSHCAPYLSIKK
ncbi:uncharacterized protein [Littorina saxatilis]|uniref:uncharacterized protein n=1 Tax=Littorina saxatilis TaxID=31220 RepID=UPI0038B5E3B2